MSISSSSSSSGSIISSMDSANEELQSLRKYTTSLDQSSSFRNTFFDFTKKSVSTNSSPLKKNVYVAADAAKYHDAQINDNEDGGRLIGSDDEDVDDFDTKSLGFDPFLEITGPTIPIASSTILLNLSGRKKKRRQSKNVRFYDWEKTLNDDQVKLLKSETKQVDRVKPPVKSVNTKIANSLLPLASKDRLSSSEYSATPDTTEVSEPYDQSDTLSAGQKLYILDDSNGEKKSHLKRSELYTPLTDLTKTPKVVGSSTEPIVVSASTDESSVFSKSDTRTEPSAQDDAQQVPHKLAFPVKSISWRKFYSSERITKNDDDDVDAQNNTLIESKSNKAKTYSARKTISPSARTPEKQMDSRPSLDENSFSLRLQQVVNMDTKKPLSKESADESYDQVDILDQSPPQLPNMDNITANLFKNESGIKKSTLATVDGGNESGTVKPYSVILEVEIQEKIKKIIESLAHTSSTAVVINDAEIITNTEFKEKIDQIDNLSQSCDKRFDNLKIQMIKFTKQIKDHENIIKDRDNSSNALNRKLGDATEKLETLGIECTRLESKVASQLNTIKFERQSNKGYEKDLLEHKKLLTQCQNDLETKELYVENITRLVRNHYLDHELDLMDETKAFEALKELLSKLNQLNDISKAFGKIEKSLKNEITSIREELVSVKNENTSVKRSLNSSQEKNSKYQATIELKDKQLENLKLENENYNNLLTSLECSYTNIKTQLENEKFRTKELELKIQELEAENGQRNRKTAEMEKVLSDQLSLVNDVKHELEEQASTIAKLNEENKDAEKINTQLIDKENIYKEQITHLENEVNDAKQLSEKIEKSNEANERRFTNILRSKDDDIMNFKRRITDLEITESNLASELKDTRAKFSDKFSQGTSLEKKVGNLTTDLKDVNETNRVLRSKILHKNSSYQELKRALTGLSISIVRDLDGIIDDESLSTVREDISNEPEEKQLQKLHDTSIFIEEAVCLIVKEYWSLTKRLTDSQRGSLSNNSLGALQLIIERQNDKLKQLQAKLTYYESIFRKINRANSRSSTSVSSAQQQIRSSARPSTSRSSTSRSTLTSIPINQKKVRIQMHSEDSDSGSTGSIHSSRPLTSNMLREKREDEINRLLSKVNKENATGDYN